jgi:hypothetical protein
MLDLMKLEILKLDKAGMPVSWLDGREALAHYATAGVLWELGDERFAAHGGTCALTGRRTVIELAPIIAVDGDVCEHTYLEGNVPLNNRELFRRDRHVCLFCYERFPASLLTRDHVVPLSRGGLDVWSNCATACFSCNNMKGDAPTPEAAGMRLGAVPFEPTRAEYLILKGRRIRADQMDFLMSRVKNKARFM